MDVAIFGAGIAGLMSAIALRAQGHQCTVYERSRQSQGGGMGYIMVPEGIARLEGLGVQLKGSLAGVGLDGYSCRDATGEIVCEQAMPKGARGLRRRDLIAALLTAFGENAVVDAELSDLEFDQGVHVSAARFQSRDGSLRRLKADLYVGAEGVNSRARRAIFPDWPTTPDRIPEMVGLVRCNKAVQWAGKRWNKFHAVDGGIAFGILPVDEEHVVWYLQFDSARYPLPAAIPTDQLTRARQVFVGNLVGNWAHPVPSLLAATDFTRVHLWRPVEADLVPQFHRGNLVLVGDAAHPLSPFTSQGVASAIADAVVLAKEIQGVSSASGMKIALDRYSRRRREDCAPYHAQGRKLSANFLAPLSASSTVLPIAMKATPERDVRVLNSRFATSHW